jgi:hypothetical protein
MKIKRTLSRLVVLMAMMLSIEMSAEGKIKYRLPSDEEQRLMREEVYFPPAKRDNSSKLYEEIKGLIADKRNNESLDFSEKQRTVITNFLDNTYVQLPISKMKYKVDFDARSTCLKLISELEVVRSDTNVLYSIARFIGQGVYLSIEKKNDDIRMLQEVRKHLCFQPEQIEAWKTQPDRYGCIHPALIVSGFEDLTQSCIDEYTAREKYNRKLEKFRFDALRLYWGIIKNNDMYSIEAREKIWEEFCQKAKATEDEKIAAEKAAHRIKEEKKIVDKNKDVEISVEF